MDEWLVLDGWHRHACMHVRMYAFTHVHTHEYMYITCVDMLACMCE